MHLVQILLPLYDNDGHVLPPEHFQAVRAELAERFGGLTAFTRAPAEGVWRETDERTSRDEIVVFEVMVRTVEAAWWKSYRQSLEALFRQQVVIIRAQPIRLL